MDHNLLLTLLACGIGFLMTWGVGANDLANVMSTTMGSKAITVRQAMLIAVVFEFAGAILGSGNVSNTIRSSIINTQVLTNAPEILAYGMLAVLFAGSVWMLVASYLGLPVSITNAIVGGLVGFGAVVLGMKAIHWGQVGWIAFSWVASPSLAGIAAYMLFRNMQRLILATVNPLENARRYIPIYFFLVGIVLAFMTVLKGMKHVGIVLHPLTSCLVVLVIALLLAVFGSLVSYRFAKRHEVMGRHERFAAVEKLFSVLMAFTACAMVFAHGSNDVAIAVGPMATVISIAHDGGLHHTNVLPLWIVLIGCFGVVTGLFMYGRKVIETVGEGITTLTPSRAFAATFAAAATVIVSTSTGIPVSATQTLVGGVLGVGLARGIAALNMSVIRNIFLSWLITIPAASILAIMFFYILRSTIG